MKKYHYTFKNPNGTKETGVALASSTFDAMKNICEIHGTVGKISIKKPCY